MPSSSIGVFVVSASDFFKELAGSAPAPYDETPAYAKFSQIFILISILIFLLFSYVMHLIPEKFRIDTISLARAVFPFSDTRIEFLLKVDAYSAFLYSITLVSVLFASTICLGFIIFEYWRKVAAEIGLSKLNRLAAVNLSVHFTVFALIYFFVVVYTPSSYDPRFPGNIRFILWPIFPVFCSFGFGLFNIVFSNFLIAFAKMTLKHGVNNVGKR